MRSSIDVQRLITERDFRQCGARLQATSAASSKPPAPLGTHDWALTEPSITVAASPVPPAARRQDIA